MKVYEGHGWRRLNACEDLPIWTSRVQRAAAKNAAKVYVASSGARLLLVVYEDGRSLILGPPSTVNLGARRRKKRRSRRRA